jgi:WD40 repeat protein
LTGHSQSVQSVVFSPDGTRLASCSDDNTVRLWDAHTGGAIGDPMVGHTDSVNSVVFSSDGTHLASCSHDDTVRLWDAHTGGAIGDPMVGHTFSVNSVVFSPDGTRLASCSFDNTVRLWDARTGGAIGDPMVGHTDSVNSVVFSPDGTRLASYSFDNTVRLWDAHTGGAIGDPIGHFTIHSHVTIKHNQPLISPVNGTEPFLHSLDMLNNGVGDLPSGIHDGWLFLNEFHLLWIPVQYRGHAVKAMMNNGHYTVCIGGEGGSVIFIRLPIDQVNPKIPNAV